MGGQPSTTPAIGCVVDGCPPNVALKQEDIQKELNKRKPGQSKYTTQRKEGQALWPYSKSRK